LAEAVLTAARLLLVAKLIIGTRLLIVLKAVISIDNSNIINGILLAGSNAIRITTLIAIII